MTGALDAAALIVGIDDYLNIPKLGGCTHDAVDFADWLIGIGVPRSRIRINIAPRSDLPKIKPPEGVILGGASRDDIWESITGIAAETGDWLFVLWSGHGYYLVEQRGPIFLTQEWMERDTSKNLDVIEFSDYFQSLPFKNQWVVVDACQNYPQDTVYRSGIKANGANVSGWSPINSNAVALCCAVNQEEIAPLVDGRGLFTRKILEALKAAEAGQLPGYASDAINFDWVRGLRKINLQPLFNYLIRPAVTEEAAAKGGTQNPTIQLRGAATARSFFFIRDLPSSPITEFEVDANPATAVDLIRVWLNPAVTELRLPSPGHVIPFKGKALTGARLFADCVPKLGWEPDQPSVVVPRMTSPEKLFFNLSEPPSDPGTGGFNIRVIGPDGVTAPVLTDDDYKGIRIDLRTPPQGVHPHEYGPNVDVTEKPRAARNMARRLETSLRTQVAKTHPGYEVFVATPGQRIEAARPNLRVEIPAEGAAAIVGYLKDEPIVRIERIGGGPKDVVGPLSLDEIAARSLRRVDPGLYRVRVDAPWGSSLTQVEVTQGAVAKCILKPPVGRVPLRNSIATGAITLRTPFTIVPDPESHATIASSPEQALEGDELFVQTIPGTSVLIQKTRNLWRAEPYSSLPLVEWDMLIGVGRLQDVDLARAAKTLQARSLDAPAIERDLLRLALAYASRAQGDLDQLVAFLGMLETPAAKNTTDARALNLYARGVPLVAPATPPLFRWGETLVSTRTRDTERIGGAATSSVWGVYHRHQKPKSALERTKVAELTTEIVAAYVSYHKIRARDVSNLINAVGIELASIGTGTEPSESKKPEPAVPVRRSVRPDHLVCLICGRKQKLLKRHLAVEHELTPNQYRETFGLKPDYPMVAPNYAKQRSELAAKISLGRPKKPARRRGRRVRPAN